MSTTTHHYLLFFVTIILCITCSTSSKVDESSNSIYQVLMSKGLPEGLFPKGVKNFSINENGSFEVYLDDACDTKFESELHYEKIVSGYLSLGHIGNLTGISAQDLFLWFPVKGIRVDIPSSGVIYFDVGVVHKQFSVSLFDTPRDCVADTHSLDATTSIPYKLSGALRYSVNWWSKKEGEIM